MGLRSAQQDLEALVTATGCGCTTKWADPLFDDSLIELTAPEGKVWLQRSKGAPTVCPKCKSPYWKTPKRRKGRGAT